MRLIGIRLRQHKVRRRLQLEASNAGPTVDVDDNETAKVPAAEENVKELICGFAKHNSVAIPDIKKMKSVVVDGIKEKVPVRFRRDTLRILHNKFLLENTDVEVSFSHFAKHFPTETVVIPGAEDWGTAGCGKCLNPRFKVEALHKAGCTTMSSEEMCEQMRLVTNTTNNTTAWNLNLDKDIPDEVTFMKWVKVDADGSSVPIDRKEQFTKSKSLFQAGMITRLIQSF